MTTRLYLGRLPSDTRSDDIHRFLDSYGAITDCRVMRGFGFVEFEDSKDAEAAIEGTAGKPFLGVDIVVEYAKEAHSRREPYAGGDRYSGAHRSRRPGVRLIIQNVSRDVSWQDLKDFGREAGNVTFADIDRDVPGQGVLEYASSRDAELAMKELDGRELRGKRVEVTMDDAYGGPNNFRRDDRRDDYREDYNRYDRRDKYRRERSRSPVRRRSPPPRREDDRRGGYDDHRREREYDRRSNYDENRRRDDYDRDSRRREDRSDRDRYDDRRARGDNAWSR